MSRRWVFPVLKAAVALMAGGLGLTVAMGLLDTEAGGGRLTGPLVRLCLCGSLALLLCAALSFTRRAVVTVSTLTAALLCLPLFLYRLAPSLLDRLSDVPASTVPIRTVTFEPMATAGLVTIGLLVVLHAGLRRRDGRSLGPRTTRSHGVR